MDISINSSNNVHKPQLNSNQASFQGTIKTRPDSVSLSKEASLNSAKAKIDAIANEYMDKLVEQDKPIILTATRDTIPLANAMQKAAYQKGSGFVSVNIVDPNIEKLKAKYGGTDFEYKKINTDRLKEMGAVELTIESYDIAKLTKEETKAVIGSIRPEYSAKLDKMLEVDPKDIVETDLNLQPGQPLSIYGEREHEKNIERVVEYALKKGPRPINVVYSDSVRDINFYTYASDKAFETAAGNLKANFEERISNKSARLFFDGNDATALESVPEDRMSVYNKLAAEARKPYMGKLNDHQWCITYAPTTLSAKDAYPEGKTPMESLELAAKDVKKLNRVGNHKAHFEKMWEVVDKVNGLNLDQVHIYSLDPKTGEKDGKTDLYVGLSQKSKFCAVGETSVDGVKYFANIPSEEAFSSPDKYRTNGVVSATKPLVLNGKVVEGIRFEFKDGKIVDIKADTNEQLLKDHIADNENADYLGEVALVAGSPIFDTGRLFYSTLLDENATCHLAFGDAFGECLDGHSEISDDEEKEAYFKANNFNRSTSHDDFMVGGLNVVIDGITRDGKTVTLIKDNKYQI